MSAPALTAVLAGARRARPPKVELRFDVTVRNGAGEVRWAILKDSFRDGERAGASTRVFSVDLYELSGTGRVAVAHFIGDGGFYAAQVPADSELRLNQLPISYWGELPEELALELVMAGALLLDDRPAQNAFSLTLLSDPGAEVDASPLADQRAVVEAVAPPAGEAFVAEWVDAQAARQAVTLDPALTS
jgi:hypothetical protein